jgi:hypothetical protein
MANKVAEQFAQERGLDVINDVAVFTSDHGYIFTFGAVESQKVKWGVSVPVSPESYTKENHKKISEALKPYKMKLNSFNTTGLIQITVDGLHKKGIGEKTDRITTILLDELPKLGITPSLNCILCGQPGCSDKHMDGIIFYPAHKKCKEEKARAMLAEIEENQANGNVALGLVGALIGGLVGCIPSFVTAHFFDSIWAVLFMLIPAAAYGGYKLFKGLMNRAVPFVIAIISLASTIVLVLSYNYTYVISEIGQEYLAYYGKPYSITYFLNDILVEWELSELLETFGMPLLFCCLGIFWMWSVISKGNKSKQKEAQQLLESTKA